MRLKTTGLMAMAVIVSACASAGAQRSPEPANGREVIARMYDAYAGKWYRTLTFVQKTTIDRPGRPTELSTWYEAMEAPGRLRIDFGDPKAGNGVLYTADSLYVVRGGKLTRSAASGNEFLPLTLGVYTQPVARTISELETFGFNLDRVRIDEWRGRPVYVVGATDAADSTSAQFWVDRDRLILVRMIKKLDPRPEAKPHEIDLDGYVPLGQSWLPTRIAIVQPGGTSQMEEYTQWEADVALPPDVFNIEKWMQTPHWAEKLIK